MSHLTCCEPGNTKFESYGLGKGINMYQLSPWSSRSTQCRIVDFPKNATDNTEDRQYDLTTVVESESSLHGKLSMGANIPEAFTKVNVAFDLTRDRTNSKKVNIKCRTKAKYYFKEDEDGESVFEQMLKQFRNEKESEYGEEWCKEFLKKHDNITHYVSSITLGAMQCTVLKEFTRKDEFGVSVEVELPKIGELGAGGGTTEQTSLSQQETKIVGTFTDDKTAVASPEVIHYECKPLFTLVSDPELKTALADQVKIETPNRIFCVIHTKTKLEITKFYWSLDNNGCLYLTEDKNTAALFYLRFTSPAEPPYFCITHVPPAQTSAPEQPVKVANPVVANPDESLNTAKANSHQNAERYISISTSWSHALPFGMGNDEVKLSAKMHANPAEVVFEFRNRVNPKAPVCISEMDILLLQQSNYMCIKPKRTGEFLTGCYDGTMCKLHLVSINKAESKSKPYFPLFGMESS